MKKWFTISLTLVAFGALVVAFSRWWLPLLGLAGAGNELLQSLDGLWPWLIWIFVGALVLLLVNLRWDRIFSRARVRRLVDEAEEWSDEFRIGADVPLELTNQLAEKKAALRQSKVRLFPEQSEQSDNEATASPAQETATVEPTAATPGPPAPTLKPLPKGRERVTIAFADEPESEFVELPATGELTPLASVTDAEEKITPLDIAKAATLAQAESFADLPPLPEAFTGRAAEWEELLAALAQHAQRGVLITGLGGSGKTALALKLAHHLAPSYPDAQFYLDLKGTTTRPLTATEAQAHLLRVYQPGTAALSNSAAALRQAYEAAFNGKRVLFLFDNAADAQQLEPLLPPQGCLAIATARQPLELPHTTLVKLAELPTADAAGLLRSLVPRLDEHADQIAQLCGGWPLALHLAASALTQRPELTAANYTTKLAQTAQRLQDAGTADPITTALTLSYELLNPGLQKLWRSLAVFPDTFDVTGAAAVWTLHPERALKALRRLMELELVEGHLATGRYRLHDLKFKLADTLLPAAERYAAQQSHADYYQSVLHEAEALYEQGGAALKRGLGLVDRDWHNLEAGQAWAAAHAASDQAACELCSSYPDAGRYVLELRQSPQERLLWCEAALAAAVQLKRRKAESRHLLALGKACLQLNELDRACDYYELALALTCEQSDASSEARALNGLGALAYARSDWSEARRCYLAARNAARVGADQRAEARALGGLGLVHSALGEAEAALKELEQQLNLTRTSGDWRGEADAFGNLAAVYFAAGDTVQAQEWLLRQLALMRELGDRHGETHVLNRLTAWRSAETA